MEQLINKIKRKISLSAEAEAFLYSIAKQKTIPKGEILIHQNQIVKKVYYVTSGCLRSFCIDNEGKEHTLLFAINGWWMSDYIAVYSKEKANLSVESLMETTLIEFQAADLEKALHLFPELEAFQRANLEQHVVSLQRRILNQLQLSATARYNLFLAQYPDIEQHTRNYHIASYLGLTQVSLSRIRKQKANK